METEGERHVQLEILSTADCISLLRTGRVGRVAFAADGLVHVIPVNYACDDKGHILFRTNASTLLNEVASLAVGFEVDSFDVFGRTGWSVCVHGVGHAITSPDDPAAAALRAAGLRSWAPGDRSKWLTIEPLEITGRRLDVNPTHAEGGWWFPDDLAG